MNIAITFAIITATAIASSVATFKIWEKESYKNYDIYDKALSEANQRISQLLKANSKLQAQLVENTYRINPAQEDFYVMPTKKAYKSSTDIFGEW